MEKKAISSTVFMALLITTMTLAFNVRPLKAEFSEQTQWTGLNTPIGVAIGDYDNDGLNDLAFAEDWGGRVTVYKSDGTTVIKQWTGLGKPQGVAIGDYDNDGLNDLAFTEYDTKQVTVYKSDGTTVIKQWTGIPSSPIGVAIGDYDNDGLNDLAFSEIYASRVWVYKSDGTTVIKQFTGLSYPHQVAIGDYDNDGLNDLAVGEGGGNVTVYKSDGTTVIKQLTGLSVPYGVAIGDYNNDGLNDLAFSENGAGRVTVYYSAKPTLTITKTNERSGKTETITLELVDEDHDGLITIDIENSILSAIRRTLGTTTFDFPGEYTATQGAWTTTLSCQYDYTVTFT